MFKPSRLATWPTLTGLYLLYLLLAYLGNTYFFGLSFLESLYRVSSGLVHPTLILNFLWIAIFSLLLLGLGKFNLRDFGFRGSLPKGVLYTASLWAVIQLVVALWQLVAGNGVRLLPDLSQAWTFLVGTLIAQLFGNVLLEEPLWRGFVWSQLAFKLRPRVKHSRLYAALLGSLLFALVHIHNQLVI